MLNAGAKWIFWLVLIILLSNSAFTKDKPRKLFEKGNYQAALKYYERILKQHPDWEAAHFGKGAVLYKQGEIETALQEFEQAIGSGDADQKSAAFYNAGNALLKSNRLQEALQFYKRSLEIDPRDFDAKHNYELARRMLQQQQSNQSSQGDQQQNQKQQQKQSPQDQKEQKQSEKEPQQQKSDQQKQKSQSHQKRQPQPAKQDQQQKKEQKKEEAAKILNALKDNEKDLIKKRLKSEYQGIKREKDW